MQPTPPVCQAAWQYKAVFAGTVNEMRRVKTSDGFNSVAVQFTVDEPLLGMDGRGSEVTVRTGQGGGDCGYGFEVGHSYIIYADTLEDGTLRTGICSRTGPIAGAAEDLAYFHALSKAAPRSEMRGTVLDQQVRNGMKGTRVILTGEGIRKEAVSDGAGNFRFPDLAPGKYGVTASAAGTSMRYEPKPVEIHAKGCAFAMLILQTDRRIRGRVLDEAGRPAAGIQVQVLRNKPVHQGELPFVIDETKTGVDGLYEIANLNSGDYYVGVNLARTPSMESPYSRYFYAGTEDPLNAKLVHIDAAAGTQEDVDFQLPRRQQEKVIEGAVFWPDGRPAENVNLFLEDPRWPWQTSWVAATTDAQGRFHAKAFDGTNYRLHAIAAAARADLSASIEPVSIRAGTVQQPFRLILTQHGSSVMLLTGKGLERWSRGEGLD